MLEYVIVLRGKNMKRFANYYIEKHNRKDLKDTNTYLYSNGKNKTAVTKEELPKYYLQIIIRDIKYYISLKGIKDIEYRPSFYSKKFREDDRLFISYKGIFTYDSSSYPKNPDLIITGDNIDIIINKLDEFGYNSFTVDKIKSKIDKKNKWYDYWSNRNWDGDYALTSNKEWDEILNGKPKQKTIGFKHNI